MIKQLISRWRAVNIKANAGRYFAGVVHNCCNVSANNHDLAFVIKRSVFGYPMVEQIKRPGDVMLHEDGDYVIVKDGYVYELTKRVE